MLQRKRGLAESNSAGSLKPVGMMSAYSKLERNHLQKLKRRVFMTISVTLKPASPATSSGFGSVPSSSAIENRH